MVPSGSHINLVEAIEHEGEFLLVTMWLTNPALGLRKPGYVIPMRFLRHQQVKTEGRQFDFVINAPLPSSLFDGTMPPDEMAKHNVQNGPEIPFPFSEAKH
jgi:hypothetical protein